MKSFFDWLGSLVVDELLVVIGAAIGTLALIGHILLKALGKGGL